MTRQENDGRKSGYETTDLAGIELRAVRNRELEIRRMRGEISCAECRRLKLKCDKKLPCTPCKRRGCPEVCPTGVGTKSRKRAAQPVGVPISQFFTSKPPPAVPPSDSSTIIALRAKLTVMSGRIRVLEEALQTECAEHRALQRELRSGGYERNPNAAEKSDEAKDTIADSLSEGLYPRNGDASDRFFAPAHPLLSPELLDIKEDMDIHASTVDQGTETEEKAAGDSDTSTADILSAFGTLSISDGRIMSFLGASVTSSNVLMGRNEISRNKSISNKNMLLSGSSLGLPSELAQAGVMWPFAPSHLPTQEYATQIYAQLPSFERARAIADLFFINLSWIRCPVDHDQVYSELLPLFYPHDMPNPTATSNPVAAENYHDLALFFAILACGTVSDLSQTPDNEEASRYNMLSRATLGLQSVFEEASLSSVQAVFLLGTYEGYAGRGNLDSAWRTTSLALFLSSSIGLHRDPERWKLDDKIVQRRRLVFWEMFLADHWRSLGVGRPTTFKAREIDVQFPKISVHTFEEDESEMLSVQEWRYRFARDVLHHLSTALCSAQPIKYSEILDLDRRIRNFAMHPYLLKPIVRNRQKRGPHFFGAHPLTTAWYREMALLFVHRNLFTRAITEFPNDPLHSPLGPSIIASYHSASCLLRILREALDQPIALMLFRLLPIWSQALSCTVILAIIAAKGRLIGFSNVAFKELELSIAMLEKLAPHPILKTRLPLIRRMRDKARSVLSSEAETSSTDESTNNAEAEKQQEQSNAALSHYTSSEQISTDELLILSGVLNYVPQNSTYFSTEKEDTESSSQAGQAPETDTTLHSDGFVPSSNVEKESSGVTGSDLYQHGITSRLPGEHINENDFIDPQNQSKQGIPENAFSVLSSHPSGLGYGQGSGPQFGATTMTNEPHTGQTLTATPMDPFGPTDTSSSAYRLPELSAADLDSIMSYPVSWAPSMAAFDTWPPTGTSNSTATSSEDEMDWSVLLNMAGMSGSSDDWMRMATDWDSRPTGNSSFM